MGKLTMAAALLGALVAAPAHAQSYWRLGTGVSKPSGAALKDRDFATGMGICADIFCAQPADVNHIRASFILEGAAGHRFTPSLRGEVMYAYRGNYALHAMDGSRAAYNADLTSTTLMLNGYYDFAMQGGFQPYLGMGIGWARNRLHTVMQSFPLGGTLMNTVSGGTKNNPAFALMAGVSIPYPGWTLDIGYRYVNLGSIQSGNFYSSTIPGFVGFPVSGVAGRLRAHELTVGARF